MYKRDYKIENGYFLLEHEKTLVSMLQQVSPDLHSFSPDTQDWLRCQRLLNQSVTRLVNGDTAFSIKRPYDWFYRFIYPKPEFWRGSFHFDSIGPYTRHLTKFLKGKSISVKNLYIALKVAKDFLLDPPAEIATEKHHQVVQEMPCNSSSHSIMYDMQRILHPLNNEVSVYMLGSISTGDYTPFSDVDDLVIIHRDSWDTYERFREVILRLERVSRLFQCVDPLQHHGHWVFLDFDMVCLDQSTMPLIVLENGIVVVGRRELEANIQIETRSFGRVLWTIIQEVRNDASSLAQGSLNLYRLKNLVAGISLLPALTFQVQGKMLDKKTAILKSKDIFSDQAILSIQWATEIRDKWASCPGYKWIHMMRNLNRMLPFRRSVLDEIAQNYSPSLHFEKVPFLTDETIMAIFQLTDECSCHLQKVVIK